MLNGGERPGPPASGRPHEVTPAAPTSYMAPFDTIPPLLAARLAERPDAPLLVDALTGETRTYAEADRNARRWAAFYRGQGLGIGDRVAIVLPNSLDFAELYLGAAFAGITLCPYNPALSAAEIAALTARFGARLILATASRGPDLAATCALPLFTVGARGDLPAGLPTHAEGKDGGAGPPVPTPDTLITLIMTSGTTGGVKACRITHGNVCWTAARTAEAFGLGPESRYLTPLPLYHINAQVVGLLAAIHSGGAVALGPRLPAPKLWEAAARVDATGMSTVPAIIHDLLAGEGEAPPSLRFVVCSSAPLPQASRERFQARFRVPLLICYGLSEAACFVTYGRPESVPPTQSVGVPGGYEVRIGDAGEVLARGPGVFDGYDGDADATTAALRDGWLHTGDRGDLVPEPGGNPNCLHLVLHGRIKEMINRGGEKIAPDAIEAVLRECPGIEDVAVFAIPDDRLGEDVGAAVVARSGLPLTDDHLWDFCAERLAEFETPKVWFRRTELPRGATGKVLRRALQEDFARCKEP